jgi:hypothetical protein
MDTWWFVAQLSALKERPIARDRYAMAVETVDKVIQ